MIPKLFQFQASLWWSTAGVTSRARSDDRELSRVTIFGVSIHRLQGDDVLREVRRRMGDDDQQTIMYVNSHTLNIARRESRLRAAMASSTFVLNDGIGVGIAARVHGTRFPENLNGSDFTLRLLSAAAEAGWRTFFLGGRPGVADEAAERLRSRYPRLKVVGTRHGFHRDPSGDAKAIRDARADLVLVAFGNPEQELWLAQWLQPSQARLGVAVGAFLDFQAGRVSRAPKWMNDAGIEWLYRLAQEPARLWRRYLIGNPVFLACVVIDRVRHGRRAQP
jgi:exopolysaccharide biosynthesis WecB/TagA/CpsF family protein